MLSCDVHVGEFNFTCDEIQIRTPTGLRDLKKGWVDRIVSSEWFCCLNVHLSANEAWNARPPQDGRME